MVPKIFSFLFRTFLKKVAMNSIITQAGVLKLVLQHLGWKFEITSYTIVDAVKPKIAYFSIREIFQPHVIEISTIVPAVVPKITFVVEIDQLWVLNVRKFIFTFENVQNGIENVNKDFQNWAKMNLSEFQECPKSFFKENCRIFRKRWERSKQFLIFFWFLINKLTKIFKFTTYRY